MKNWKFDKKASQILHPRRGALFLDRLRGANAKFEKKPTPSKTNFSSSLCLIPFANSITSISNDTAAWEEDDQRVCKTTLVWHSAYL